MPEIAARRTYAFHDAPVPDRTLLGGKGAGLVEMVALGLPVPPGFILSTPCGRDVVAGGTLPDDLAAEVAERIRALEDGAGRRFGDDDSPLLVSVRSGAPVSMPGMMDTILNCGLTRRGVAALARETGDERFAYSCFERLLLGFATTVRGMSVGTVEDALIDVPGGDALEALRGRCDVLEALITEESGSPFPDPEAQLHEAIEAVFRSWGSRRAQAYRRHKGIDDAMGTAVVVQQMVFGNRGERSGSGVAFTRDPSTGESGIYGDFLFDAQGEDVVSGERDTLPLTALEDRLPEAFAELTDAFSTLEASARDMCDVEFTVEDGRAWVLQTRPGQRSGRAAVRLAVAFCEAGAITEEEAVARVSEEQLEAALAPVFAGVPEEEDVIARGLAASPGAVVGRVAFEADRAVSLAEDGADVVLVRPTTSPTDLPGVLAAVGVVTGRGGRTSHAAVVARGLGRAAVCGAGPVVVAADGRGATVGGRRLREGDLVSVDGDHGIVSLGARPTTAAEEDPVLRRFLGWTSRTT
jgi:pyruvate,orthophosphate dikinase